MHTTWQSSCYKIAIVLEVVTFIMIKVASTIPSLLFTGSKLNSEEDNYQSEEYLAKLQDLISERWEDVWQEVQARKQEEIKLN